MSPTLPRILAVALCLALLPTVGAKDALTADAVQFEGATNIRGDLAVLQVFDASGATVGAAGEPSFTITADRVTIDQFEQRGVVAAGWAAPVPDPSDQYPVQTHTDRDAKITLTDVLPGYYLQALSHHIKDTFEASSLSGEHESWPTLYSDRQQFRPTRTGDAASPSDNPSPTRLLLASPHTISKVEGASSFQLKGTFVLEMEGFDLKVAGRDYGTQEIAGTYRSESVAPGVPAGSYTMYFLRITLVGAVMDFSVTDGAQVTRWAVQGASTSTTSTGTVSIERATGSLDGRSLLSDSVHLAAPYEVAMAPEHSRLSLLVQQLDGNGQPVASGSGFLPSSYRDGMGVLLAGLAVVALPGLAVGLGIRQVRVPTLPEVEAALEAGHYRRAARLARRLIKKQPELEGAWIGRGIALTKEGESWRAVEELSEYLEKHTPSDGVIHYVLGTALMDIGHADSARRAFDSAVSRTPALMDAMQNPPVAARPDGAQAYS